MKKTTLLILALVSFILIMIGSVVFIIVYKYLRDNDSKITNFQECIDAGNPILETYPRQCKSKNGKTFTESLTGMSNPASVYCTENGGVLEIRDETEGQVGYCQFENNKECEEWAFFRNECTPETGNNIVISTPTNATSATSPTASVTTEAQATVSVYMFDEIKFNQVGNSDYVTKYSRKTTRKDVATFAVEEIIKGPNASEEALGARATFGTGKAIWFVSDSNCYGKDFQITIVNKMATVKFCRDIQLAGDSSGFIIEQQINSSVKQFPTVSKSRVLTKNGECLDDMSGIEDPDLCYQ